MLTFLSSFSGFFDKNGEDLASSKSLLHSSSSTSLVLNSTYLIAPNDFVLRKTLFVLFWRGFWLESFLFNSVSAASIALSNSDIYFLAMFFELWTEILINNVVPLALISFFSDLSLSPFVYSLYQENILNQFVVRFMSHLRRSRCSSSFIHNGLMKFQFFNFL